MAATVRHEAVVWCGEDVKRRLCDAADTLKRLPFPRHGAPTKLRAGWPDVVRNSFDDWWGTDITTRVQRGAPSPEAIGRMDEALGWLHWLTDDQRKVVWARACGTKWRALEDIDGRCKRTLEGIFATATWAIAKQLNGVG